MAPPKLLRPPEFSDEECRFIVDLLLALKAPLVKAFFAERRIERAGITKAAMRERLTQALDDQEVNYPQIISYVDSQMPWGKQHVYLMGSPVGLQGRWKDTAWVPEHLGQSRVKKYYNARLPLILPEDLTLSSIEHSRSRLVVTAVQRRDYTERDATQDKPKEQTDAGEEIEWRAYVHHVTRGWVRFEWDLVSDLAMLQVGQLQGDSDYGAMRDEFGELVGSWLDVSCFPVVDLRRAIPTLHERVENGDREVRFVMADYRTAGGRRLAGFSASGSDELFGGEEVIDTAMQQARENGIGNKGNIYWLSKDDYPLEGANPLTAEFHVHVIGADNRLNIPTPHDEDEIRHVLRRLRQAC